ncbi:hypothetical protein SCE1572_00615 [Sorangium cellulosum So0157-2]|uniref:Uncharacterized protein n=1 Tax=Sorangium cellulosum So0157-2 TaxID=1254432 RepID=S4XFY0_SORCE|nr:hypothetical protein SCE1572_00615 [Sorangium cellulosum So0157-2]
MPGWWSSAPRAWSATRSGRRGPGEGATGGRDRRRALGGARSKATLARIVQSTRVGVTFRIGA